MMGSVSDSHNNSVFQLGATMVELIVTIVIMSIALVALAMTVSYSAQHSADAMVQVKVVELAQAYAEEILTKRFDSNSPIGGVPPCSPSGATCSPIGLEGESRENYDDVDDYHGLDESPPQDSLGVDRPNYEGYRVTVDVSYMTAAQQLNFSLDDSTDAKLIILGIYPPSGSEVEFSFYKGNF